MDCSTPGHSVHGISQTRILEWVAISFSRGSSLPRVRTQVSYTAGRLSFSLPPIFFLSCLKVKSTTKNVVWSTLPTHMSHFEKIWFCSKVPVHIASSDFPEPSELKRKTLNRIMPKKTKRNWASENNFQRIEIPYTVFLNFTVCTAMIIWLLPTQSSQLKIVSRRSVPGLYQIWVLWSHIWGITPPMWWGL